MTRFRSLALGVSLAALASAAFASTASAQGVDARNAEIAALRAQVELLSQRLEVLETARTAAPAVSTVVAQAPIAIPASAPAAAPAPQTAVDWSSGLPEMRSPDGAFSFRPRLRVTTDLSTTTGSRFDNRNLTGTELRGIRVGGQGRLAGGFAYWVEADLADSSVNVVNAFVSYNRKISGRDLEVSFGQRLNDRGVEGGTAEDQTPFLERSFTAAALGPERGGYGLGVSSKLVSSVWHASLSVTGDAIGDGTSDDSIAVMARTHWSPLKSDQGFLHLGGWGFVEELSSGVTTISRSNLVASRFNDNLRLGTGAYAGAQSSRGLGLEVGGVRGPAWLMVEGGRRAIQTRARDFDQNVFTISTGWFVTGEAPPLSTRTGTWARPRVLRPVGSGGSGALEIVARYDDADFSDNPTGGEGDVWLLGANWYPTSQTRVSLHLSRWSIENRTGTFAGADEGQTATVRVQAGF